VTARTHLMMIRTRNTDGRSEHGRRRATMDGAGGIIRINDEWRDASVSLNENYY